MQVDTQTEKEPKRPTDTERQTDRVNSKLYSTGIVV